MLDKPKMRPFVDAKMIALVKRWMPPEPEPDPEPQPKPAKTVSFSVGTERHPSPARASKPRAQTWNAISDGFQAELHRRLGDMPPAEPLELPLVEWLTLSDSDKAEAFAQAGELRRLLHRQPDGEARWELKAILGKGGSGVVVTAR
eukprot:COSAG04_NODE_18580_length_438_cov_0.601770_1_plen_145_part_11